jgi:hypothetical protein
MRIWETDMNAEDGLLGRRNDVLGMTLIDRAATERPEGTWVTFRHFTNDHPRRAGSAVAIRALVRTRRSEVAAAPAVALEASCASDPAAPQTLCEPYDEPLPATPRITRTETPSPPRFPATLFRVGATLERVTARLGLHRRIPTE